MKNLIKLRYPEHQSNRGLRRKMKHEYNKVFQLLWPIEKYFYVDLFHSRHRYEVIYRFYNYCFNKQLEYIQDVIKPKYILINTHYFSQMCKPIEKNN